MTTSQQDLGKPQQVTFDITDRCQMQCVTCSKWHTNAADVMGKELTTQEWKDVLFKLKNWLGEGWGFCFSGGEPFLREDIFELIEYAKSLNIHPMSMSNAFSISNYYEKIVDSSLGSINISLNSIIDKSIHDTSRGREGSCDKAIEALLTLNKLKKEKGSWLSISVATIMMPENIYELIHLVEFVTKHKLNGIMFQLVDDIDSFHAYNSVDGLCTSSYKMPEELYKKYMTMTGDILPILDKLIEMKKAGYSIYNSIDQLEAFKIFFKNPSDILKLITCDVGATNFAVDPYGDVRLCFNMDPVGSIKDNLPEEIWENAKSVTCRKATKACKMYCRMLNCNFKENFSNQNKTFYQKLKNKVKKSYVSVFG